MAMEAYAFQYVSGEANNKVTFPLKRRRAAASSYSKWYRKIKYDNDVICSVSKRFFFTLQMRISKSYARKNEFFSEIFYSIQNLNVYSFVAE